MSAMVEKVKMALHEKLFAMNGYSKLPAALEKTDDVARAVVDAIVAAEIKPPNAPGDDCTVELAIECAALREQVTAARAKALEDAAKACEKRAAERFDEFGITEPDTNASYYSGRHEEMLNSLDEEDDACATAIRALVGK